MDLLITLIQFFASLSLLVVIHELGHFLTAKAFGVRVDSFYIFFNPWFSLFKYKPKGSETTYGVGWLPLGGYVKLAGMIDESMDTAFVGKEPEPWEFRSKPAWQRLIIMIAGVVMNFVLANAIYIGMMSHWGTDYLPMKNAELGMNFSWAAREAGFVDGDIILTADGEEVKTLDSEGFRQISNAKEVVVLRNGVGTVVNIPEDLVSKMLTEGAGFASFRVPFVVSEVIKDSPAEKDGLESGDRIVRLDGIANPPNNICSKYFAEHKGETVNAMVLRGKDTISMALHPDAQGRIGVYLTSASEIYGLQHISYSFIEAIPAGIKECWGQLTGYVNDMKYVFTPEGAQSMGGFGAIASLFPETFNARVFWTITAFLSVVLAFMNILPIPGLDGGHTLFVLYEIIFRRKPSEQFLMKAQMAGIVFLILLAIFANTNDVLRLFK